MAVRQVIQIDEEKCTGCAICATACHEGAIGIVDGKARLLRDDYCDGMGDCLPACPTGAITFIEREAAAYDEAAVKANMAAKAAGQSVVHDSEGSANVAAGVALDAPSPLENQLKNWPIQIKLCPITSSSFDGAHVLIAADCTAFAYANFHADFIANRTCLIACPKLDAINYAEKLTAIFASNNILSITVTRMIVPCCGGLENAVSQAIQDSGKDINLNVVTMSLDGTIV